MAKKQATNALQKRPQVCSVELSKAKNKFAGSFDLKTAIQSQAETLVSVKQLLGPAEVYKHLTVYLVDLNDFIGGNISDNALAQLAKMIYSKVYYYNLHEVAILFNVLKQRKYFTRSANEILQGVEEFIDERLQVAEHISLQDHANTKAEFVPADDQFIEKFYTKRKQQPVPEEDAVERKQRIDDEFRRVLVEYETNKDPDAATNGTIKI